MKESPPSTGTQASIPAALTLAEQLLARNLQTRPHALAFVGDGLRMDYAGFGRLVDETEQWLAARGVGRGDVIAVWLVNRVEWLALWFALARRGAALMAVNTRYRAHELEHILETSRARMLVLQLNFRKIDFPAVLESVGQQAAAALDCVAVLDPPENMPGTVLGKPAVAWTPGRTAAGASAGMRHAESPAGAADPDLPSILFTTSGTTSKPKLVVHTQRTITLHSQRVAAAYGIAADDAVLLAMLPFCGVFGFNGALAAFCTGRPVVMLDVFDSTTAARLLAEHAVTHTFGSDEMYRRILDHVEAQRPFPAARVFGYAAFQPGFETYAAAAWERSVPLTGLYGSSEVQALFALQPHSLAVGERVRGGGAPASPDARVRVRDTESGALLPPGESGMLEIAAPTNFVGYLRDDAATRAAIDDEGYFRTGDIGYLRADGTFVYQTRQGDAIRLAGFLVNPAEIEDALEQQPGVASAQVVAVEIDRRTVPVAYIIPTAGAQPDADTIRADLAGKLASFKVPARIWRIDSFPVAESSNGTKVQRARLRQMAQERLAEEDRP
ncbi:AMP-binding protein [Verticiella sediminum]|uniref:Long-chain-fatty-acid--CoA ligase n=1 Tax=Verticiella sediminum TaxID=1247510 RepID=A0A556ACN1_9BURK|nr:AMP-binding protein [Verticiella sediminum]TSH90639.1 AMP-binding protein [Verticiella sediminum]